GPRAGVTEATRPTRTPARRAVRDGGRTTAGDGRRGAHEPTSPRERKTGPRHTRAAPAAPPARDRPGSTSGPPSGPTHRLEDPVDVLVDSAHHGDHARRILGRRKVLRELQQHGAHRFPIRRAGPPPRPAASRRELTLHLKRIPGMKSSPGK